MTRLELQQRLQNNFNNSVYYTGQNLNDSIQDGLDEVVAFAGTGFASIELPFTQNLSYYDMIILTGGNYIGAIAMFNKVIRRWMIPKSRRKFENVRVDWETAPGTPEYFAPVSHRYLAIYKKPVVPNYGNFIMFYRSAAPTLTDSTPIPLPDDHITTLESYCKCDLWEQNEEFTKAGIELKNYIEELAETRKFMSKKDPDRMSFMRSQI